MLTPAAAEELILQNVSGFSREDCPILQAHGRVLRAEVRADRDLPPFDRVTMDGYALRASALAAGTRKFRVEAVQAAGMRATVLGSGADQCIEVMTGAVLPSGADCVVPYEDTIRDGNEIEVTGGGVRARAPGTHSIHRRGSDHRKGEVVLTRPASASPAAKSRSRRPAAARWSDGQPASQDRGRGHRGRTGRGRGARRSAPDPAQQRLCPSRRPGRGGVSRRRALPPARHAPRDRTRSLAHHRRVRCHPRHRRRVQGQVRLPAGRTRPPGSEKDVPGRRAAAGQAVLVRPQQPARRRFSPCRATRCRRTPACTVTCCPPSCARAGSLGLRCSQVVALGSPAALQAETRLPAAGEALERRSPASSLATPAPINTSGDFAGAGGQRTASSSSPPSRRNFRRGARRCIGRGAEASA